MKNIVKTIILISLLLVFVGCGNTAQTPPVQEEIDSQNFVALSTASMISGASWDLDKYKSPYTTVFPLGKTFDNVVGFAIASNDYVYVWYDDQTVSVGTSWDLDKYLAPVGYNLPPGKTPEHIVDIAISPSNIVYTWYLNGTFSIGTVTHLGVYLPSAPYSTPNPELGYGPSDIEGIAIAPNNKVYVWYRFGDRTIGTAQNLSEHTNILNLKYDFLSGNQCAFKKGMGIAKSSSHVYTIISTPHECPPPVG